jgi:hypothetical protein
MRQVPTMSAQVDKSVVVTRREMGRDDFGPDLERTLRSQRAAISWSIGQGDPERDRSVGNEHVPSRSGTCDHRKEGKHRQTVCPWYLGRRREPWELSRPARGCRSQKEGELCLA